MAGETSTVDVAEKPSAYEAGLKGYLQSQTQPQSFLEHPATNMIPIVGPILSAFGDVQKQKRLTDAIIRASYFNDAVKLGDLTPDHPATQGIPLPIIQAGLLESKKVQSTPSYQARKEFQQTYTPGTNYEQYALDHPATIAALGSPDSARVAFESAGNRMVRNEMTKRGLGGVSASTGTAPATSPTTTPFRFQSPSPEMSAGVGQVFGDYDTGKIQDTDLEKSLSTVPGMTPENAPALAQAMREHRSLNQRGALTVDALGQFNPNGQGPTDVSFGTGPSGIATMQMTPQTPEKRAAAYLLHHTLQNPANFQPALRDITGKSIALDPKVLESIQQQATAPTLIRYYTDNLNRGLNPQAAGAQAALDTARAFNITDPEKLSKLTELVKDPAVVARIMEEARTRGERAGMGGPEADIVRGKDVKQAGEKEREIFTQKSDAYYKTPLDQLPNGEGFAIAKNAHISNPHLSMEQWHQMGGKFTPDELLNEFRHTQVTINLISHLRDLYQATNPEKRLPVIAALKGVFQQAGAPFGMAEEVRDYMESKAAFASRLQAVVPENGIRLSPKVLEGYLDYLPKTNRVEAAGLAKFDQVIRMLQDGYNIMKDIYTKQGTAIPELTIPSQSPTVDKDLEELRGTKGKK